MSRTAVPIRAESELGEPGLAEQLARTGAVREAVEPDAEERTSREPAEHDRRQQPDDEQQQRARDTREGVAELIPGALEDGGDHGRSSPTAAADGAGERDGDRRHQTADRPQRHGDGALPARAVYEIGGEA